MSTQIEVEEFSRDVFGYIGHVYFGNESILLTEGGVPIAKIVPHRTEKSRVTLEVDAELSARIDRARVIYSRRLGIPESDLSSEFIVNSALEDCLSSPTEG